MHKDLQISEGQQLYISDKQVAERYGVTRASIWRWVRRNNFPQPVKISPGCTRWPMDAIKDYEQKKRWTNTD